MPDLDNPGPRLAPAQIRDIRKRELGLSLDGMSKALGYGYSTVQRYETEGARIPDRFFIDFETLRARVARARAEAGERPPARPTHPQALAEVVRLELPVMVAALLHARIGDALAGRGRPDAHPAEVVEEAAPTAPAPSSGPPAPGEAAILPAVLVNWPPVPFPRRGVALLRRRMDANARLLPAGVIPLALLVSRPTPLPPRLAASLLRRIRRQALLLTAGGPIPLAVLVSTPNPVGPHPLASLRRQVYSRRPMLLPADVPSKSQSVRRKPRRPRWSTRAERRLIAAGLAFLMVGSTLVLLWSIRADREPREIWGARPTGALPHLQPQVDAQRERLKPFKGQKQAPCDLGKGELEIDQLCWWWWEFNPTHPCPSEAVKHEGKCLLPVPEGTQRRANEP